MRSRITLQRRLPWQRRMVNIFAQRRTALRAAANSGRRRCLAPTNSTTRIFGRRKSRLPRSSGDASLAGAERYLGCGKEACVLEVVLVGVKKESGVAYAVRRLLRLRLYDAK